MQSLQTFSPPVIILLGSSGIAQTHTEKASSPNNLWSDQRLMPRGNKGAGFTPGLSPHHSSGQIKTSCKVKHFVITGLFTQAGTRSKESPFLICLFCIVHSLSKPFLALVVQTEPPDLHCQTKIFTSICVSSVSTLPWLYYCYYSNLHFPAAYHNPVPKQAWDQGTHPPQQAALPHGLFPADAGVSWAFTLTAWVKRWAKLQVWQIKS